MTLFGLAGRTASLCLARKQKGVNHACCGLQARCIALAHGGSLLIAAIRQSSERRSENGLESYAAGFSIFIIVPDGLARSSPFYGPLGYIPPPKLRQPTNGSFK